MKKLISVLICLLLILTLLLPAGGFISTHVHYIFRLSNVSVFILCIVVLSASIVALDLIFRIRIESRLIGTALALLPPLAVFTGVLLIVRCPHIWAGLAVLAYEGCCFYLSVKHGKPLVLKIVFLILSVLISLPLLFFAFIGITIGNFGIETVIQSIPSPSGQYYAQVIDHDQGALGGNTVVDVYESHKIDAYIFQAEKEPQRVYVGDWGEYETMQIYWKDDHCLVINGMEYQIE